MVQMKWRRESGKRDPSVVLFLL